MKGRLVHYGACALSTAGEMEEENVPVWGFPASNGGIAVCRWRERGGGGRGRRGNDGRGRRGEKGVGIMQSSPRDERPENNACRQS